MIPGVVAAGRQGSFESPWTPGAVAPALWLDVASNTVTLTSGAVSSWGDSSGNGYSVSQPTAARRPGIAAAALAGRDVVSFDGADDALFNNSTGALSIFRSVTFGYVASVHKLRVADGSTHKMICFQGGAGPLRAQVSAREAGQFSVVARRLDSDTPAIIAATTDAAERWVMTLSIFNWGAGTGQVYIDGELDGSGSMTTPGSTSNTTAARALSVAAEPAGTGDNPTAVNYAAIDLAEIVVGNQPLSPTNIDRFFGYLAHKWGLQSNLPADHPYKSAAPMV